MNGAVVSWGIFDEAPGGPRALANTELATRSPHLLSFQEEDRGKRVYITIIRPLGARRKAKRVTIKK
jgi:hypothetical protein